jgi:type IV pilus assembly protein PilX
MKQTTITVLSVDNPMSQRGITLIMGLMFLIVLTILGLAAMRGTILEERMAGNARDRDLALQSAEAAIRAAEQALSGTSLPQPIVAGTAYAPRIADGTHTAYWQTTHPWTTQSVQLAWQPQGTDQAPRYVVEELSVTAGGGGTGGLGIGSLSDEGVYRVTARGVGSNPNTVVILQSIFER